MWWHLRKQFERGEITLPPNEEKLVQQLTSIRQSRNGDVIHAESRREYYERTGYEPLEAIAFAVSFWAEHATLPLCSVCGGTTPPLVAVWDDAADQALRICSICLPATLQRLKGER
jgi:hypothetical protein